MMTPQQEKQMQKILSAAYQDYERGLNVHAFFKTSSHEKGEDLVQETFMKTWCYLVKGGKIELMKAFLYHVLNHLIIDEYRKHKTVSLDDLKERGFEVSIAPFDRIFRTLDAKVVLLLIQRLPIKYQALMSMKFVEDLSLEEISAITGQSRNAVAVQIHRGLAKLKVLYNLG